MFDSEIQPSNNHIRTRRKLFGNRFELEPKHFNGTQKNSGRLERSAENVSRVIRWRKHTKKNITSEVNKKIKPKV